MELTIGCTTRPYGGLPYAEAYERIAAAGYTDVAVFANEGQVPVRPESTPEAQTWTWGWTRRWRTTSG